MSNPLEDPMYFSAIRSNNDCISMNFSQNESILDEVIDNSCAWCKKKHKKGILHAVSKDLSKKCYHKERWYATAPYNGSNEINTKTPLSKPYKPMNLCFCDLACAKLYHDNVMQIEPDLANYRELYLNDKLSKEAKSIYERACKKDFNMLLIMRVDHVLEPDEYSRYAKKYALTL
jgi:hypothetical protein